MTGWFEAHVPVTPEISDAVSNFLFELGCTGCQTFEDALVAYFPDTVDKADLDARVNRFIDNLRQLGLPVAEDMCRFEYLKDRDWNAEWQKFFKPLVVSKKFIVKPTWEDLPDSRDRFVLEIDPKQAFGTGSHATTRLMLRLLEGHPLAGKRILDVGTGTGILAIAAAKLGAGEIVAFDNDPIAVDAAVENIQRNLGETDTVRLLVGTPDIVELSAPFDVVVANLTSSVILKYIDYLVSFLAEDGRMFISGILDSEVAGVRAELRGRTRLEIIEQLAMEEWVAVALARRK